MSLARGVCLCILRAQFKLSCWKDFFTNPLILKGWESLNGWKLGSYSRFMLKPPKIQETLYLWLSHQTKPLGGLGAVDSTLISLGKTYNKWDKTNYKALRREKCDLGVGSLGESFGVKLHLVSNSEGEIHAFEVTSASTHDLTPIKQGLLSKALGIVLADRGYISQKEQRKFQKESLSLWAKPRQNQENQFCPIQARLYKFREVAESIFAKLKQSYGWVPKWPPRRLSTGLAYILGSLAAYVLDPNKPKMNWNFSHFSEK